MGNQKFSFQKREVLHKVTPLSPSLFVMCMEILSKLLDKAVEEGKLGYHPKCKALKLTHLLFADDLVIFIDHSLTGLKEVLDTFYKWSRLKVSYDKSEFLNLVCLKLKSTA